MVRCPKCGAESPDQARFCRACGQALGGPGRAGVSPLAGMTPEERARRLLEEAFRLSEEGKLLAAIQVCHQAVTVNPNSTSAHSLLGTLYERQGDRDNAIREYEQVLTLSPGSTVERRRLNELMGLPAAREAVMGISPRTARLAVTGGGVVVVLVLIGALMLTMQRPPQPRRQPAAMAPAAPAGAQQTAVSAPAQFVPSPGSVYAPARFAAPRMFAAPRARPSTAARVWQGYGGGTWVAPGTYFLPVTGAQRAAAPRPAAPAAGPFLGAVPMTGAGPPTVGTPVWGRPAGPVMPARAYTQAARDYYFQGNYQQSIAAYQSYLAQNPRAGAAPREELAWVYTEAGDRQRATQQYHQALDQYQSDFNRGHNVEAARHGVRTCESALRALQAR